MKKFIFLIVIFTLSLTLTACSSDKTKPFSAVEDLSKAKDDIAKINKNTDKTNENIKKMNEEVGEKGIGNDQIRITNIQSGDILVSPVRIEGEDVVFKGNLFVELRNGDHKTMVKEPLISKSAQIGESKTFAITLNFEFSNTKEGYVAVYELDDEVEGEKNLVEIPVKFE